MEVTPSRRKESPTFAAPGQIFLADARIDSHDRSMSLQAESVWQGPVGRSTFGRRSRLLTLPAGTARREQRDGFSDVGGGQQPDQAITLVDHRQGLEVITRHAALREEQW